MCCCHWRAWPRTRPVDLLPRQTVRGRKSSEDAVDLEGGRHRATERSCGRNIRRRPTNHDTVKLPRAFSNDVIVQVLLAFKRAGPQATLGDQHRSYTAAIRTHAANLKETQHVYANHCPNVDGIPWGMKAGAPEQERRITGNLRCSKMRCPTSRRRLGDDP